MFFYSLDGKIKQYQLFTRHWRKDALLQNSVKVVAPVAAAKAPASVPAKPIVKIEAKVPAMPVQPAP